MSYRFFLDADIVENRISLEGDQAYHAIQVMRLKVGDTLTLFNGRGTEHAAVIVGSTKKKLDLEVRSTTHHPPAKKYLSIACALPKGDRQKFLVEKLVELGVSRLIPLQTRRSVAIGNQKVIERMKKHVIESSKQCGRNFLMEIEHQCTVDRLIETVPDSCARFVADPYSDSDLQLADSDEPVVIAIGPEGGFEPGESERFAVANWQPMRMGHHILRIETAAIAAAVLLGMGNAGE